MEKSDVKSCSKTSIDTKGLSIGKVWLKKCRQEGGTQSSEIIFSSLTLLPSTKIVDIFSTSIRSIIFSSSCRLTRNLERQMTDPIVHFWS